MRRGEVHKTKKKMKNKYTRSGNGRYGGVVVAAKDKFAQKPQIML